MSSVICGEFVQNAWRKDLCSNCFKPRSDHHAVTTNGGGSLAAADDDGSCMPPLVSAAPKIKMALPYVPFKRTILEMNRSNGSNGTEAIILGNGNNNNNGNGKVLIGTMDINEVRLPEGKFSSGSNGSNGTYGQPPRSKVGSSGVHLWEVGQALTAKIQAVKVGNGKCGDPALVSAVDIDVRSTVSKPGILKDKPACKNSKKAVSKRSSVVFTDESQVIGYGGNDYAWDDDQDEEDVSSEDISDVDSLDNYDMTEEDKVFGALTDRNTEYNADNTNLLLMSESHKQPPQSIFGGRPVADKLNPQSFYSMPATKAAAPKTLVPAMAPRRWIADSLDIAASDWEVVTPTPQTSSELNKKASVPERDSSDAVPEQSSVDLPSMSSADRSSPNRGPNNVVAVPQTCNGAVMVSFSSVDSKLSGSPPEKPSSSPPDQSASDARCFINSLFSAESTPTRLSFLNGDESEDDGTFMVKSETSEDGATVVRCGTDASDTHNILTAVSGSDDIRITSSESNDIRTDPHILTAAGHRAGSVTVPTRKHPVTHRATAQQLFNEEPVTAAELRAVSEKLQPSSGNPKTRGPASWTSADETSSLMSTKPIVTNANKKCSPYGIVPVSRMDDAAPKTPDDQRAPVIPSIPPPASNDESQRYPCQPKSLINGSLDAAVKDRSILGPCSTFQSPVDARFRNREYAAVNYSCHYASSYITNGNGTGTAVTLPPTPLTNPYSSTAILKGIPQGPSSSAPESPLRKPRPVTKPKPKLPVKPVSIRQRSSEDPPSSSGYRPGSVTAAQIADNAKTSGIRQRASEDTTDAAAEDTDRVSACYQEIDNEDYARNNVGSEFKTVSSSSSLDFGKRTPKRQAPRPPPNGSMDGGRIRKSGDRETASRRSSDQNSMASQDNGPTSRAADNHDQVEQGSSVDRGTPSSIIIDVPSSSFGSSSGRTGSYSFGPASAAPTPPGTNGYEYYYPRETPLNGKPKKSKFSLKKLLKFGSSNKDDGEEHKPKSKANGNGHERRTKLEILHPIDLINSSCSGAEAASNPPTPSPPSDKGSGSHTGSSSKTSSIDSRQEASVSRDVVHAAESPRDKHEPMLSDVSQGRYKPPPPPRSRSSGVEDANGSKDKPSRPPPPIHKVLGLTRTPAIDDSGFDEDATTPLMRNKDNSSGQENDENRTSIYSVAMEYANLGDVRNKMAPKKPGRCSSNSMMDISAGFDATNGEDAAVAADVLGSRENDHRQEAPQFNSSAYAKDQVTYYAPPDENQAFSQRDQDVVSLDDLYDDQIPVTSDPSSPMSSINTDSVSSSEVSNGNPVPRPSSAAPESSKKVYERPELVYTKTPPESSGAAGDPDEGDLSGSLAWPRRKSSRLSLRKTKTVVHKNLEDNYGAVVSANHQTLTQILEQVTLTPQANASKTKQLEDAVPRWSDFRISEDPPVTFVGDKAFYSAIWQHNVELTLMVSREPMCAASQTTRNSCVVLPIVEFEDVVPASLFLGTGDTDASEAATYVRGTVWVLDRTRVTTLSAVAATLSKEDPEDPEASEREACFVLLQLINGLKHLQVLGIEEVSARATDFALTKKLGDANHRLVILPGTENSQKRLLDRDEKVSLCQSALAAMLVLLGAEVPTGDVRLEDWTGAVPSTMPSAEAFRLIAEVLWQERATSLSRGKLLLEYLLWGPTDLQGFRGGEGTQDPEPAYQRWLDLERATVLNNLIRTQSLWQIRLTVFEEYMLAFLVRTCAKTLRDAADQLRVNEGSL